MTRPYAEVIGDPVAHSKSPLIHGFWLEKLGIDAEYRKTHVRPEELAAFLARRRTDPAWRGCNVTVPHKEAVIAHLDRLDPLAARIGAVNTVAREDGTLVGYNSDAPGFMEPVHKLLSETATTAGGAFVIGAGGAARAIVFALIDAGFNTHVVNRDPMRAAALLGDAGGVSWLDPNAYRLTSLKRFSSHGSDGELSLIVNATSLGMVGQPPLGFSFGEAIGRVAAYDIVYAPLETPLLKEARARGLAAIDGLHMLVGQAAIAFEKFFGAPAPRQHDAALRALLTA